MLRRDFLRTTSAGLATASGFFGSAGVARASRRPRVLLRSSWQTVNIGDIAHTPGVLALLEKELPEAEVWLWPSNVENGVRELLEKRFPQLRIVQGKEQVAQAMTECDYLLHGSGPSLVAQKDVQRWKDQTGKPFGVWGITLTSVTSESRALLSAADFVLFRDTVSLDLARQEGIKSPVMRFGPDGAFNVDLRNDAAADRFLAEHQLEPGEFVCCLSRLRYTPYWKIKGAKFDQSRHDRNELMREQDHAPLRQAIVAVVEQTGKKVLLCPEDASQMEVGKQNLFDPLPHKVKSRVVWRENYWLTDEALSTYLRSAGLFGSEMHSPIMAVGNGVPAIVCRFAEQTSKGYMWRDIGLNDWLFNLDNTDEHAGITPAVLNMLQQRHAALEKVAKAQAIVARVQNENIELLRNCLSRLQT